jgi:hypothetical protein
MSANVEKLQKFRQKVRNDVAAGGRPVIQIVGGELPAIVDAAEGALLVDNGPALYQRGGVLVRILRSGAETVRQWLKRKEGSPVIRVVEPSYLVERLTSVAIWLRFNKNGELVPCDCPERVARTLAARGMWKVRALVGIIESPTLRPDGSVLDVPGYDERTGLYYDPGSTTFPPIPESPTRDDALRALAVFKNLLAGFPFVAVSDLAAAIAAILTALIRRLLKSAPLVAFRAPKMGSGKSLLADVVSMVATGRPCAVMSLGEDANEERKRWLAVLLEGDPVVCIDNVERPLGGSALCSILTQETYRDRILGVSQTVSVSTAVTLLATGNNLTFDGDLTTRVIPCDLDPGVERPEERTFDVDLYHYVPEHRGELVAAGLTILRAFVVAGRPKQEIPTFGRFEEWSDWVRSALVWLGTADPCAGRSRIEELDPTRQRLGQLLIAWNDALPLRPSTVADAVRASTNNPDLREALLSVGADRRGEVNPRYVGNFLLKHIRRIEGGFRFVRGETRGKVATWTVESTEPQGVSGVSGVNSNARESDPESSPEPVGKDPSNPSNPFPSDHPCVACGAEVGPDAIFCGLCWSARQARRGQSSAAPQSCPSCHGTAFWLNGSGDPVCRRCHSPASEVTQ